MVPCVLLDTPIVVTVKVAVVEPAGTVTLVGTKAGEPFVQRKTTIPPDGAALVRVTVPVVVVPPLTLPGLTDTPASAAVACAGVTEIVVVLIVPL
jgi:hypothetical protein